MSRRKRGKRTPRRRPANLGRSSASNANQQDWSRAGAHNVAGVTFQVAMTASLLLEGRAGQLSITRVTPEGYEDIDAEFRDETRMLIQVKERSPTSRFTRSNLSDALGKKAFTLTEDADCHFVLATNATLGRGLSPTGWDQALSECVEQDELERLAEQLRDSFDDPFEVLRRTHILEVGWDVVERSRQDFAQILETPRLSQRCRTPVLWNRSRRLRSDSAITRLTVPCG